MAPAPDWLRDLRDTLPPSPRAPAEDLDGLFGGGARDSVASPSRGRRPRSSTSTPTRGTPTRGEPSLDAVDAPVEAGPSPALGGDPGFDVSSSDEESRHARGVAAAARAAAVPALEAEAWATYWRAMDAHDEERTRFRFLPPDALVPAPPRPGVLAFLAFCALAGRPEPGPQKGASLSLELECFAINGVKRRIRRTRL